MIFCHILTFPSFNDRDTVVECYFTVRFITSSHGDQILPHVNMALFERYWEVNKVELKRLVSWYRVHVGVRAP